MAQAGLLTLLSKGPHLGSYFHLASRVDMRRAFPSLRSVGGKEKVDWECARRLWPERVDDFHAGLFEVRAIARHDR